MKRRFFSLMLPAALLTAALLSPPAYGAADDYDPVTGEPKCTKCHRPDKAYSIDYSRDETCVECHGPGLSDEYLEINDRFRVAGGEGHHPTSDMESYIKTARAETSGRARAESGAETGEAPEGMTLIPGGEFTMGSNEWWPKSQPEHTRTVDAFYLDTYEVTNSDYREFVEKAGYRQPDHWKDGRIPEGKEDHPVVYVTWYDAESYCRWKGRRLPTEVEWEKAARGPEGWTFPWGDKFERDYANTPQYGNGDTLPVGSFEEGTSYYGVYDMTGNAWEWTDSWFKPYPGNNHPDENYGERYKVLKGGSWYDCTYYKCGISAPNYNRIFFQPNTKNNNFGFRCASDR